MFNIISNVNIAPMVFEMVVYGEDNTNPKPGQFINIKIDGMYLRRPISVCDAWENKIKIIYKTVGRGTEHLSEMKSGECLDILTNLGNGYDLSVECDNPVLIGGGVGVPPLYMLSKKLVEMGKNVSVILGFNTRSEVFYEEKFSQLGANVLVTTVDGSYGIKGFVTDALKKIYYDYFYTCGPEHMLMAVYNITDTSGQFSFERRMGCGFGACMGCSCKTITGNKRICKEGPVLFKEDIIW